MGSWSRVGHPTTIPDGVDGLPHNHVITVRNRRISIDDANLVQNNVRTDTIALDLDSDWDGLGITVNLGECPSPFPLIWEGSPLTIPAAACAEVGGVDVSIVGVSSDGKTQVVTVESNNAFKVQKSGCVTSGDLPEDPTSLLGQVLAAAENANKAAESADTAATSANSAATAATTAAQSANTAASNATSAANSANTAASNATSAANSANAAAQAASQAAERVTENILTGTVDETDVAQGSNAWAQAPLELDVYGNTRQNLIDIKAGTTNGVTVDVNDDGSIHIEGTSTNTSAITTTSARYVLKPGVQYTASIDKVIHEGLAVVVRLYKQDGSFSSYAVGRTSTSTTFMVSSDTVYATFVVYPWEIGVTVSGTYRVMLNEGSEAEPWCPPGLNSVGDDGSVKIVTAGKNLLKTPSNGTTGVGVSVVKHDDGSITFDGTATSAFWFYDTALDFYLPSGTYTLSGFDEWPESLRQNVRIESLYEPQGNNVGILVTLNDQVGTVKDGGPHYFRFVISAPAGTEFDNVTIYPQLELGSTATAYEPPNITTTPIDLDGNTLCSLPDGTRDVLTVGADGACSIDQGTIEETFDGGESWLASGTYAGSGGGYYDLEVVDNIDDNVGLSESNSLSENFRIVSLGASVDNTGIIGYGNGTYSFRLRPYDESAQNAETFKTWLSAHPQRFLLPRAEHDRRHIDLTAVTLPPLPQSFNMWVQPNANGVPATLAVDYARDVTKVIGGLEARVAALEDASQ